MRRLNKDARTAWTPFIRNPVQVSLVAWLYDQEQMGPDWRYDHASFAGKYRRSGGMLLNRGYFIRGFYTVNFHRLIFQCNIGWLSLSFLLVCSSRDLEGGPEDVLGTPHSCTQRLGYKALFLSISRKVGTSEHSISSRKIFTRWF